MLKLAATIFTLGAGGVSAMFVPLFLTGGAFGVAFAQSVAHSPALALYAAVGMACFIAAGYKTPLAAVVFVAEATGGHAFIIPSLIGAAVAYAVSGDASASGDQRLHEAIKVHALQGIPVSEVMQSQVIAASSSLRLREFAATLSPHTRHEVFPVFDGEKLIGTCSLWSLSHVPPEKWNTMTVRDIAATAYRAHFSRDGPDGGASPAAERGWPAHAAGGGRRPEGGGNSDQNGCSAGPVAEPPRTIQRGRGRVGAQSRVTSQARPKVHTQLKT